MIFGSILELDIEFTDIDMQGLLFYAATYLRGKAVSYASILNFILDKRTFSLEAIKYVYHRFMLEWEKKQFSAFIQQHPKYQNAFD